MKNGIMLVLLLVNDLLVWSFSWIKLLLCWEWMCMLVMFMVKGVKNYVIGDVVKVVLRVLLIKIWRC